MNWNSPVPGGSYSPHRITPAQADHGVSQPLPNNTTKHSRENFPVSYLTANAGPSLQQVLNGCKQTEPISFLLAPGTARQLHLIPGLNVHDTCQAAPQGWANRRESSFTRMQGTPGSHRNLRLYWDSVSPGCALAGGPGGGTQNWIPASRTTVQS